LKCGGHREENLLWSLKMQKQKKSTTVSEGGEKRGRKREENKRAEGEREKKSQEQKGVSPADHETGISLTGEESADRNEGGKEGAGTATTRNKKKL